MTSTTCSNKNFKQMFLWMLRRNKAIIITYSILMAFGILIDLYIIFTYRIKQYHSTGDFQRLGTFSIVLAQVGAMLFTFISANNTFSFLHNKRKMDLYGALPVKRQTLFLSSLLSGITSVLVPYVAGSLIVILITGDPNFVISSSDQLLIMLTGILGIIASYSFSAMVAYCTGTTFDMILVTIFGNLVFPCIVSVFWVLITSTIPGLDLSVMFNTPVLSFFTPYAFSATLSSLAILDITASFWALLIWSVVFSAGCIAIGLVLSKRYRAETAQSAIRMKWLPIMIKIVGSVTIGSLAGLGAAYTTYNSNSLPIFGFWYMIAGFIAFIILHFLFSRGFKVKLLPSLITYTCTSIVVLGCAALITTGLGLDTYVPKADEISSVRLGGYVFEEPENIQTVVEIHQAIADDLHEVYQYPYNLGRKNQIGSGYVYGGTPQSQYPVIVDSPHFGIAYYDMEYTKKNGAVVKRYYSHENAIHGKSLQKLETLLEKLINSEEYKKKRNPLLWNEEDLNHITVFFSQLTIPSSGNQYNYSVDLPKDRKFTVGLLKALKQDMMDDTAWKEHLFDENSTDSISLSIDLGYDNKTPNDFTYISEQIPHSYSHTRDYLESAGIRLGGKQGIAYTMYQSMQ